MTNVKKCRVLEQTCQGWDKMSRVGQICQGEGDKGHTYITRETRASQRGGTNKHKPTQGRTKQQTNTRENNTKLTKHHKGQTRTTQNSQNTNKTQTSPGKNANSETSQGQDTNITRDRHETSKKKKHHKGQTNITRRFCCDFSFIPKHPSETSRATRNSGASQLLDRPGTASWSA